MRQPIPVDARRADWPRLVAQAVNGLFGRMGLVERPAGRTIAASASLTDQDRIALVDASGGPVTITLPPATDGRIYTVKKVDASANAVTVDADGAELIDGAGTLAITTQWAAYTLYGSNEGWWIV